MTSHLIYCLFLLLFLLLFSVETQLNVMQPRRAVPPPFDRRFSMGYIRFVSFQKFRILAVPILCTFLKRHLSLQISRIPIATFLHFPPVPFHLASREQQNSLAFLKPFVTNIKKVICGFPRISHYFSHSPFVDF